MKNQTKPPMVVKFRILRTLMFFLVFTGSAFQFPLSPVLAEKSPDEILAGVHRNFPPQYSIDEKTGKPTGFTIDIMDEVAKRAGLKVRYVIFDEWPQITQALKEGRIDIMPNNGVVEERKKDMDFTSPVEAIDISIFVRDTTTDIRGIDDLQGRNVAVVRGNKGLFIIEEYGKAKPVIFSSLEQALLSLLSGNTDALVYPEPPVLHVARNSKLEGRIKTVGKPLLEIKRAIAVGKGRIDLLNKLDKAVKELIPTQEYKEIYARWHVAPAPYWDVRRVLILTGGVLVIVIVLFVVWHYLSIMRLNKNLQYALVEQKKAAEVIRNNEARLKVAITPIDMAVFNQDLDLRYTWIYQPQLGYTTENVLGKTDAALLPSDAARQVTEIKRRVLENGTGARGEVEVAWEDRTQYYDLVVEPLCNTAGQVVGITGASLDITKRKQAEDEKQQRQIRTLVLDNALQILANVTLDYDGALQSIARYLSGLIGDACTLNLLSEDGKFIHTVAAHHPDPDASAHILKLMSSSPYDIRTGLMEKVARENKPLLITDTPQEQIRAAMRPELRPYLDRPGLYSMLMVPMRAQGKVVGTIGLTRDNPGKSYTLEDQSLLQELADRAALTIISARLYFKKIRDHEHLNHLMDALRSSNAYNRSLIEASIDPLVTISPDGNITDVNAATERATGYTRDVLIGTDFSSYFSDPEMARVGYRRVFAEGHVRDYPLDICHCDGRVTPVLYNATLYHNEKGEVSGIFAAARDITERKKAEEALRASLREKDLLLSEIHHRVKNNLQVISSLLKLQARASRNPEVIKSFRDSQNRIKSMAMVHEKLYNVGDFSRIDLAGYARSLSQELFQSHNIHSGKIDLTIQTDGKVLMDIGKAIPCGLIMNELISNALQHAFPHDGQGKLQIIIRETKDREIEIVVRDNGLGLPRNVDIHQARSVGLHLVNGLAEHQLDGRVEVKRDDGTEFRITFPA